MIEVLGDSSSATVKFRAGARSYITAIPPWNMKTQLLSLIDKHWTSKAYAWKCAICIYVQNNHRLSETNTPPYRRPVKCQDEHFLTYLSISTSRKNHEKACSFREMKISKHNHPSAERSLEWDQEPRASGWLRNPSCFYRQAMLSIWQQFGLM